MSGAPFADAVIAVILVIAAIAFGVGMFAMGMIWWLT